MTDRLHLQPKHREMLEALLREHLPGVEVWAYGSRVSGKSHDGSDLDLVLRGPRLTEIPIGQLDDFEEAVRESSIPFLVEARDWARLPERFHKEIERDHEALLDGGEKFPDEKRSVGSNEWREISLGDLIDISHGFAFKGEFISDEPRGDILLTPGNFAVGGGFKSEKFKYYSGSVSDNFVLSEGDLIVSMTDLSKQSDTLGYPAVVPKRRDGRRYLHNQRLGKIHITDPDLENRYIYYVMCGNEYRHEVLASATGTTVKHTSPNRIRQFRFRLAPPSEQRDIAHVLGTLDDKIELNRRMSETLEAIARALFKSWFVDFDPVRAKMEGRDPGLPQPLADLFPYQLVDSEIGGIPEDWMVLPLDAVADFLNGLALQKFPPTNPSESLPVIKIAELRNGVSTRSDRAGHEIPTKYVVEDGDFLFSWSGSLLAKFWTDGKGALNQHLFKVTSEKFPMWFVSQCVYHHLEGFRDIAASKVTTMGHIQRIHLREALCAIPPDDVLCRIGDILQPIIENSIANQLRSRSVSQTRDLLLPKLVSGELRVKGVGASLDQVL